MAGGLADAGLGQPLYLVAMQDERVTGVLPLFQTDNHGGRRRLVSLPHTPAAGVLADDEASGWLLQSRAVTLAELRGLDGPTVRAFCPMDDDTNTPAASTWVRMRIADLFAQMGVTSAPPRITASWLPSLMMCCWTGPGRTSVAIALAR